MKYEVKGKYEVRGLKYEVKDKFEVRVLKCEVRTSTRYGIFKILSAIIPHTKKTAGQLPGCLI